MVADFLPSSVFEIRDQEAIALLQQIQRRVVQVPFQQGTTAIATAYAHSTPNGISGSSNAAPIVLLHGFDSSLLEFRRLLPFLADSCETWTIDLFGAGFTEYLSTLAVNPQTIRQHLLA